MTYRVLITGAGAIIGYGAIKSARASRFAPYVVASDIFSDAYGQYIADDFVQAVPVASPRFADFLRRVVIEKKIDLVFSGIEDEVRHFGLHPDILDGTPARLVLNQPDLIRLCEDKWAVQQKLGAAGFSTIPSAIEGNFRELVSRFGSPFIVKPRNGTASKGFAVVSNEAELEAAHGRMGGQFLAQKFVGGDEDEYTIGLFGFGDGRSTETIAFRRKLGSGSTMSAQIVVDPAMNRMCSHLTEVFRPVGPTNYQFRKEGDEYLLLEINPRLSSSSSLRTLFGFNEVEMAIEFMLEGKRPTPKTATSGQAVRFVADHLVQ